MNNRTILFSIITVLLIGALILVTMNNTCTVLSLDDPIASSQQLAPDAELILDSQKEVDSSSTKKVVFKIDDVFKFKQFTLTNQGKELLNDIAQQIKPESIVIVVGHSDRIGHDNFNKKLSKKRADAVVKYLKTKSNAEFKSYGVGSLIPSGKTYSCDGKHNRKALINCLSPDRRIEIEFVSMVN